jgi:hypothetical protein
LCYTFTFTFTAIANALADWKLKKEASLHAGGEDLGEAQEEEEENIYAVPPELDVRGDCIGYFVFVTLPCGMQQSEEHATFSERQLFVGQVEILVPSGVNDICIICNKCFISLR